jgi:iron complex outermembrane receptor protein
MRRKQLTALIFPALQICIVQAVLLFLLAFPLQASSSEGGKGDKFFDHTITGLVVNDKGEPVSDASVSVKGTSIGTVTDRSGAFKLTAPNGQVVLTFSYTGFLSQDVTVSASTNRISVKLLVDNNPMSEVVVTALGITKQKKRLGFSVTEVKGEELAKTNEINPINALQGRVAGVQIDMGGASGLFGNSKILIRGNSTLRNNNQPIIVMDGVIIDNDILSGTKDFGNDLKNLNMEDFESVSILKGSSAAALYGSRAINGVILITSKKGKSRKGLGITFSQSVSVQDPYKGPTFQNEFGGGTVGAFFTDTRDPNYKSNENWRTKVFPTDPASGKPYIDQQIGRELENWGPHLDGQDVLNYDGTPTKYVAQPNNFLDVFQTGLTSNTNVAVEGGNDRSTFRLSYTHNKGSGIVHGNDMTKNGYDLRTTHQVNKFLSLDVSANYNTFEGFNPPDLGGNSYGKLFTWVIPRNYDTKYWMQQANYTSKFGGVPVATDPNEPNKAPSLAYWFNLGENKYRQREEMLIGRIALTATITSWAKLVLEGNINNLYTTKETKELGTGVNFAGGSYGLGHYNKQSNFLKWMLMMNKTINKDFEVNGYVGGERQNMNNTYNYSSTVNGLIYPGNYFLANSKDRPSTSGGVLSRRVFNSLYASADIDYKQQLFLQATWRGDWASSLTYTNGTGNNFYNYPAASLSWIFSETFHMPSWISFGKLRTNLAALGNSSDPFLINPGFALTGYLTSGGTDYPLSTYTASNSVQPNLKPERKVSKEIGAEMRFLKNRLGFDVSVYQDNTFNQIININIPQEAGISATKINAGNIQNKGIEIAIDGTPIKTKNFDWTSTVTYSNNRNKIVSLYQGLNEYNLGADVFEISSWALTGKSYGVLRTTIHSAAYQAKNSSGANVDNLNNGKPILTWRGDARAAFPARSNVLQDVGDINAKFRGGWNNTFRYKNLSLNILIDAKIGGDFALLTYRYGTHTGVFPNSLNGRDAAHGGIVWKSAFDGQSYDDGVIPDGVFGPGIKVTQANGTQVDVSGLSYQQAYDKGYVEPTHLPQFNYRYGSSSTGVADYWVLKNSWISLRQVAVSYNFSPGILSKLKVNTCSFSVIGRNIMYLYNTLPYNYNPESNNSNNTAYSGEEGFLPMTRTITGTLRIGF